jgi:phage/plasmid-like protein (TIGR03299 family)
MGASFVKGYFVREPAWHGQGTVIDEAFDLSDPAQLQEAIKLAGHDRKAVERAVFVPEPGKIYVENVEQAAKLRLAGVDVSSVVTFDQAADATANAHVEGHMQLADETPGKRWKAIVDESTGRVHQITRDSYQIHQFDVLWEMAQAFAGRTDINVESAGVLRSGAVGWVLGVVDDAFVVPGDNSPIYPYFSLSTTMDGSGATRADLHSTRIVCYNTFQMAMYEADQKRGKRFDVGSGEQGATFTFRHTKNSAERIAEAKTAISKLRAKHHEFEALARELAAIPFSDKHIKLFTEQFIALPDEASEVVSERVKRNVEAAREEVTKLFNGKTAEGIRNTAFGAVQVGIEYLDHVRKFRNKETYFTRNLMRPDNLKNKLVPFVRELAEVDA